MKSGLVYLCFQSDFLIKDVNVKIKTDSSAIYLISIVEEPFVLINQSYIFHT